MTMKWTPLALSLLLAGLLILAGCGGGGNPRALSGTVTDVAGNLVPGADIFVDDSSHKATTSLMSGSYKIAGLASGPHNIEAIAVIDGKEWVGTRAVDVFGDGPTMNINILIGPWDELGDIEGTVTDLSNNPLPNARVIASARYPQDRAADEASVISKVAVTNSAGHYELLDLPASITVNAVKVEIVYDVTASSVGLSGQPRGFQNVTKTATVGGGMVTPLDFKLESSTNILPEVPPDWTSSGAVEVISYTVPTEITTRAAESAYDAVKSCISEKTRKAIALKRRIARKSPPAGTLIENNVIWYFTWLDYFGSVIPDNLAGFAIYRGPTSQLEPTGRFRIDFFRDPAIVTYSDTSRDLTAGLTYWYGVTAISTSYLDANNQFNPLAESEMSYPAPVTPIGKLLAVSPGDVGYVYVSNPVFSWMPAAHAASYKVFIYETYPVVDAMFTPQGDPERPDHLPAWGESDAVTGTSVVFSDPNFTLVAGHTYWWVAMASNDSIFDNGNAYSISELRSFVAR
jgi:hypothetical protein